MIDDSLTEVSIAIVEATTNGLQEIVYRDRLLDEVLPGAKGEFLTRDIGTLSARVDDFQVGRDGVHFLGELESADTTWHYNIGKQHIEVASSL